jgi:acyl-CoA reductase-like NAD-dependent aldehyde dehydrogenase
MAVRSASEAASSWAAFLVHARVRGGTRRARGRTTAERVRLGDPFDPATNMGPLNNEPTAKKFDRHGGQAVWARARIEPKTVILPAPRLQGRSASFDRRWCSEPTWAP